MELYLTNASDHRRLGSGAGTSKERDGMSSLAEDQDVSGSKMEQTRTQNRTRRSNCKDLSVCTWMRRNTHHYKYIDLATPLLAWLETSSVPIPGPRHGHRPRCGVRCFTRKLGRDVE